MGRADYYAPGDWNTVCYQCGRKRKASTMVRNWQGFYNCPEHNEARQPQDFVRSIPDVQTAPWQQPPSQVFGITSFLCTEDSDTDTFNPMIYICTETLYPLETET